MLKKNKLISPNNKLSGLAMIILLAISYYVTAEISRYLASTPQSVTPVWPPDGLAVGAVLLCGNWVWSGVFLGSFLANILAFQNQSDLFSWIGSSLPVFLIAIGTTLGTLLGNYLLRKFVKNFYPLDRIVDVLKFLLFTGLIGPMVNATMGVTALTLSGKVPWSIYQNVWLTWWISNVAGIFIITPVLLSWDKFIRHNNFSLVNLGKLLQKIKVNSVNFQIKNSHQSSFLKLWLVIEPVFLLALLILVAGLAFGSQYNLEYMIIPVLIWSAFRFGQPGGTLANFVVAAIAVIFTVKGYGGFASSDLNQSLILLESFIGVITLTILVLNAAIAERTAAEYKLQLAFAEIAKTNENLEIRVKERTEQLQEKNIALEETLQILKRTQLQMVQSEKMSALGEMVGGVAHEINNPINFIHGNLDYLSDYSQNLIKVLQSYQETYPHPPQNLQAEIDDLDLPFMTKDLIKILDSMKMGTKRIRSIVLSLRNFSRLDEAEFKKVDLHEGIDSTLVILQHRLNDEQKDVPEIKIIKEYGPLPKIKCFAGEINQVFMNILNNAIDAVRNTHPENSHPTITIETQKINDERIAIAISDNGSGIAEEHHSRLFDPFFTTKPVGKGTGLGLSISYQIVTEKHKGKLWFESTLGQGTKFVIELPINTG